MLETGYFVTGYYVAAAALLYVYLSVRTLRLRRRFQVAIGPGEDPLLARAVRAHGNFSEYAPIALLLLFFLEVTTSAYWLVHTLGSVLLLGRLSHAYGVSQVKENYFFRVAGMALTFTAILSSALRILLSPLVDSL